MLRFKPEVRISLLTDRLVEPLAAACAWSVRRGIDVEINSIEDGAGVHMPTSLHAFGLAIDLDTVGDRQADTFSLAEWLRRVLPPGFDVVFEGDHVHVEYDAHRPPLSAPKPAATNA